MSLTHCGTQSVLLDPSGVQEIMELTRNHDQQLREARQDLLRAETNLRSERQGKWPVLAVSAGAGAVALATLQIPDVMLHTRELLASALAAAQHILSDGGVIFVAAVMAIVLVAAAILLAWALRKVSPRIVARDLMEQFTLRQGVSAMAFSDDSLDDVAISVGVLTRRPHWFPKRRRLLPATPSLASSVTSLLHRATDAAPPPATPPKDGRFHAGERVIKLDTARRGVQRSVARVPGQRPLWAISCLGDANDRTVGLT
jgi:hypothetical protein